MSSPWRKYRDQIAAQLTSQPRLFIGCDFDGTLAPIVEHPADAAMPAPTREALGELAALPNATVAIVSGRAVSDLRERVDVAGLIYVGNHGLEFAGGRFGEWRPAVSHASRGELQSALGRLRGELHAVPGVLIEDKRLTASIHFRCVPADRHGEVARAVHGAVRDCRTLSARAGRMVWELCPRFAWNKGAAVRTLVGHLGLTETAVFYVGDDTTDEDVFVAAPRGLTFRVAPQGGTSARWTLSTPDEVVELLRWIRVLRCAPVPWERLLSSASTPRSLPIQLPTLNQAQKPLGIDDCC